MSTGVLVISHSKFGQALMSVVQQMIDPQPLDIKIFEVDEDADPDTALQTASKLVESLETGNGVLILTDIYGSTPSNIATNLIERYNVITVSGLNLPMLIRVYNYPDLTLDELAEKAASGGQDGVIVNAKNRAGREN